MKCVDAFLNLQKEGFCERVFTILAEDPFRSEVAEIVYVPLEDLQSIVASLSAPKTSEWEESLSTCFASHMEASTSPERRESVFKYSARLSTP